jgi:hypothetical protein
MVSQQLWNVPGRIESPLAVLSDQSVIGSAGGGIIEVRLKTHRAQTCTDQEMG